MTSTYSKEQLFILSKSNHHLAYDYDFACTLAKSNKNTKECITEYFNEQPNEYVSELNDFSLLNDIQIVKEKIFCFVCCYNETENIHNLVTNYAKQVTSIDFEVCFIINFEKDERSFLHDYDNFTSTLNILIEYKQKYNWINIIAKQFTKNQSGLARARKYGLDYCLYRLSKLYNNQIENSIIISNEGDTLFIRENYFNDYYSEINKNKYCLIQGAINYPDFINKNKNLVYDYINIKENIHFGLGLNYSQIPAFGGIMPIGRNYCIHPKIAVKISSIDPKYNVGTDDDINMGIDISSLIGVETKIYRPIPLVTNPRREVILILEYLRGKWESSKEMYEKFHDVKYIYDYNLSQISSINTDFDNQLTLDDISTIVHDLYMWIYRNFAKSELMNMSFVKHITELHSQHEISYWNMENELMEYFTKYLIKNKSVETKIATTSKGFFNKIACKLPQERIVQNSLKHIEF